MRAFPVRSFRDASHASECTAGVVASRGRGCRRGDPDGTPGRRARPGDLAALDQTLTPRSRGRYTRIMLGRSSGPTSSSSWPWSSSSSAVPVAQAGPSDSVPRTTSSRRASKRATRDDKADKPIEDVEPEEQLQSDPHSAALATVVDFSPCSVCRSCSSCRWSRSVIFGGSQLPKFAREPRFRAPTSSRRASKRAPRTTKRSPTRRQVTATVSHVSRSERLPAAPEERAERSERPPRARGERTPIRISCQRGSTPRAIRPGGLPSIPGRELRAPPYRTCSESRTRNRRP